MSGLKGANYIKLSARVGCNVTLLTAIWYIFKLLPHNIRNKCKGGNNISTNKKYGIKILSVFVALSLIICGICVTGYMYVPTDSFTPRLTAPLENNTCYYSSNAFYSCGYGMPNCTAYAWGRAYEILGKRPNLSLGDAGKWYEYNKENKIYKYGKKPKLGAIACFDNSDGGHVAVVEKIDDGVITFSNSAYGGSNFYLSYADVKEKNPGQKDWAFQGYIYLKNEPIEDVVLNSVCSVNCGEGLNLRANIGLSSDVLQVIPEKSQIFVSNVYFLDGYKWGRTNYNGYSGYCVLKYTEVIS